MTSQIIDSVIYEICEQKIVMPHNPCPSPLFYQDIQLLVPQLGGLACADKVVLPQLL